MKRLKQIVAFLIVIVIVILANSVCVLADSVLIPDTGQTKSYTNTFGEDRDYNINPPSYTKLDVQGNTLPDSALSWSMVKDNVTGLIWEGKTDDGSIHDKNNKYNWDDAKNVFIADLNATKFGGFSDWRLPTIKELSFIVNNGTYNPAINTAYFPNTMTMSPYLSSTADRYFPTGPLGVNFFDGWVKIQISGTSMSYVRAVRGRQFFSDNSDIMIANDNGTVTDTNTNLMWQQETEGRMTWEEAISYCENLSLGEYDDWRLPNRNELQSLIDYTRDQTDIYSKSIAIDTIAFPDTSSVHYWSSTVYALSPGLAHFVWHVSFWMGTSVISSYPWTIYLSDMDGFCVRAVRGGQSIPFDTVTAPEIIVTPKYGFFGVIFDTTENGGTAAFSVILNTKVLNRRPTANVTITISSSDITEGSVSPKSIIFTPNNCDTSQTVTITGVDDNIVDGSIIYAINISDTVSDDADYNGLKTDCVIVANIDNDIQSQDSNSDEGGDEGGVCFITAVRQFLSDLPI